MRLSVTGGRNVPVIGSTVVVGGLAGILSVALVASSAVASWRPDFEAPFACGQNWEAETRSGHSPSIYSIDFNRDDDYRAPVRATAPGVVSYVGDAGSTSYGKYIRIDHGAGWESLYAHLDAQLVVVGQRVDQGAVIGLLGETGGATGPHLHFEQKRNGTVRHAVFHGKPLDYNTTINSFNCGDVPVAGDWDGNGRTDVGVFRPRPGHNVFRLRGRHGEVEVIKLGKPGDVPVTGDWNGDGRTQVGVFSPSRGSFRLRAPNGSTRRVVFGRVGSTPVTGDWNGDGRSNLGTYRTTGTTWRYRSAGGKVRKATFGGVGGIPVTGDWDSDRTDRAATWGPSTATFRLKTADGSRTLAFGVRRR